MQQNDMEEIKRGIKKVLIIKGPGIGDSVTTITLARNFKELLGYEVHVLEEFPPEKQGTIVLKKCPYIDRLQRIDYNVWYLRPNSNFFREVFTLKFVPDIFRFVKDIIRLRRQNYDMIFEGFPGTRNTYLLTLLIGAAFKVCCSSHPARKRYNLVLDIAGKNIVQIENELFRVLGHNIKDNNLWLELFMDGNKMRKRADEILAAHGVMTKDKIVCITTGQGYKRWQNAKWAKLVGRISGAKIVLVGDSGQSDDAKKINKMCSAGIVDLTGKLHLEDTIAVLNRARLFICTNGGLMWIAAALGLPAVVVSGPTPYWWDPHTKNCKVVRKAGTAFYEQPYYSWLQRARTDDVTVEDVVKAIQDLGERYAEG